MTTRSGRAAHPPKRYRPEGSTAAEPLEEEDDFVAAAAEEPPRRVRPAIRSLPDTLAAASKAQQETLNSILAEMKTHTILMKRTLRNLSETQEAILDIHEALAVVTKEAVPPPPPPPPVVGQQLKASKDSEIQQPIIEK